MRAWHGRIGHQQGHHLRHDQSFQRSSNSLIAKARSHGLMRNLSAMPAVRRSM